MTRKSPYDLKISLRLENWLTTRKSAYDSKMGLQLENPLMTQNLDSKLKEK